MGIRRDEGFGLVLAVALHAGVFALLLLHRGHKPPPLPERMTVTISDTVGLTDTSPQPRAQAAAEAAPALGEPAPEPSPAPPAPVKAVPKPEPVKAQPQPKPEPPRPQPRAMPSPRPAPIPPKPVTLTRPVPATKPGPDPISEAIAAARGKGSAHAPGTAKTEKPPKTPGASRIDSDFLKGIAGGQSAGKATAPAAAAIGPEVRAGLASAIARQLKPHWVAPQGADAELLVTVLAWDLKPDGTLDGAPRVVRQEGITDSNRPQARRHAEQAIRSVELSAPFDLPDQYFAAWRHVTAFRFDRKLSQ